MPRMLRLPQVLERTGLARPTIYKWMAKSEFPRPVKLGVRAVAWRESDINEWLDAREPTASA